MGLRINTNIPALDARRQTQEASNLLGRTLEQMASGQRINRAADDAAALAIAEKFNSRIRQAQQEVSNLQAGVSLAQTADGGLTAQQDAVQRIRELALQSANGTLSQENRDALNAEAQQLLSEIGATAESVSFNGQALLTQNQSVELGTESGISVDLQESTTSSLGVDALDLSTPAGATAALASADTALIRLDSNRANLGAQINRFTTAIDQREELITTSSRSASFIRDTDFAQASIARAQQESRLQSGIFALTQANVSNQAALRLLNR